MSEIDELRKAMAAAQVNGRGLYVGNGQHVLVVDKALVKRTQIQGTFKESWIIEFKVVQSTAADHEVGSTRSLVENPQNAGWMDRFKGALVAIVGADGSAKLSPEVEKAVGDIFVALKYDEERVKLGWPTDFLKGRMVLCEGTPGVSRGKGTPVTNKKWSPYVAPAAPAQ